MKSLVTYINRREEVRGRVGDAKKLSILYVSDRVGELNDIHISVYNPGRYVQYHAYLFLPLDLVPQYRTSRLTFVELRIPSLAQPWASRAVLTTPTL